RTIGGNLVFVIFRAYSIHLTGILLAAECGHGVQAPMNKNAKLRVLVPVGDLIPGQRLPIRTERAIGRLAIDSLQNLFSSGVVLGTGLLPDVIEGDRID